MTFHITKRDDTVVVDAEGQLIVGNRQELKQKVLDELERGEKKFLIDFTNTGYIDSSGLGVLVSLSKKIREQGGELRLANLDSDLRALFRLTRLDTLLDMGDGHANGQADGSADGKADGSAPADGRAAAADGQRPAGPLYGAVDDKRPDPTPPA